MKINESNISPGDDHIKACAQKGKKAQARDEDDHGPGKQAEIVKKVQRKVKYGSRTEEYDKKSRQDSIDPVKTIGGRHRKRIRVP